MARNVSVRLDANVSAYVAGMRKASAETKALADRIGATNREANRAQREMARNAEASRAALGKVGKVAGVAGLALAAGIGLAVKKAADFDQAVSRIGASGQDAQSHIGALRDAALEMGAKTQFSAQEAAAGIENLAKAGVKAKDILGANGGLKGTLDLAAAGSIAVADAAEIAASAMTQFGLSGTDIPHVADLLAAGAGKAQGSVADMGAALKQSGLIAANFGFSLEETTGTLAAFADAGLIGSDAGTSLKTMLQRLVNPSADAAAAMQQYGIHVADANGNLVGAEELARQLAAGLGDLTEEQKNATLAVIFGSDAVRGATVFMNQGADGIAKYIKQTNDLGYASRSAAILMDNFAGDIENLKGSLETALIGAGEGAQGPLRQIAQSLTRLVNAFNDLSDPSKRAVLGIAAVASGSLLAFAGVAKFTTSMAATRTALDAIATTSPKTAAGLRGLGQGLLIAAGAMVALKVAGAGINALMGDNATSSADAELALVSLGKSADHTSAQMEDFFSFSTKGDIGIGTSEVNGLGDAFDRLYNPTGAQKFGDGLTHIVTGLTGVKGTADLLKDRFAQLDTAYLKLSVGGSAGEAAEGFRKVAAEADRMGVSTEQLLAAFPQYAATLKSQAADLGVTTLSAKDYVDWMGGKIPAAVQAAIDKEKAGKGAADGLAGSNKKVGDTAQTAAEKLKAMTDAVVNNANAALQASGSARGVQSAINAAGRAAKTYIDAERAKAEETARAEGKSEGAITKAGKAAERQAKQAILTGEAFKGTSDESLALADSLDAIASANTANIQAMVEAGDSTAKVSKANEVARKAFLDAADAMGVGSKRAHALADQYFGIGKIKVRPEIQEPSDKALKLAGLTRKAYEKIPKETRAKIVALFNGGKVKEANAALRDAGKRVARPKISVSSNARAKADEATRKMHEANEARAQPKISVSSNAGAKAQETATSLANIKDENVFVRVWRSIVDVFTGGDSGGSSPRHRAGGGMVWGPGTTTSDSIPAMLSNREFVQQAAAVDLYGEAFMRALNSLRVDPKDLPAFASGGLATSTRAVVTTNYATSPAARPAAGSGTQADLAALVSALGGKANVNLTVNNPQAEPTSRTIATAAGYLALGV